MVDVAVSAGQLLVAFFLVALNGFFVAAEFAYVRIRSTAVESLVDEGRPGATLLEDAVANLDDYLAVCQLGITIASLGLGWIGEPTVAAIIEPVLEPVLPESAIHLAAFAIGFGFVTFLHVVFGELAPKTIAIARAERVSLLVSPLMKFFYYLFLPGIIVFNGTANFFTRTSEQSVGWYWISWDALRRSATESRRTTICWTSITSTVPGSPRSSSGRRTTTVKRRTPIRIPRTE